jgi:heme exporter protein C
VYGIIGVVSVPLTFFSIRWWRTIHPVVIGGAGSDASQGSFAMTTRMLVVFLYCNLAFTFFYAALLVSRVRLTQLGERVEQLKARLLTA